MSNLRAVKLSLIDGQRRHAPPEIGERHARGGTLYVMVEVSAPTDTWDQSSREIVTKALQTFAASQADKHAQALQAAAEAVNQLLLTQNAELPESRKVWAGFNALFIDNDELYLAQAGPALTYLARGRSITRFPKSFEELKRKGDPLSPLGEQDTIRTRLARFVPQPDDMLVLAASHVTTFDEESRIQEIIQHPTPEEVVEGLIVLSGQHDFSACVVQFAPSVRPAAEPASPAPRSARPSRAISRAPEPVEPIDEVEPEPAAETPPVPVATPDPEPEPDGADPDQDVLDGEFEEALDEVSEDDLDEWDDDDLDESEEVFKEWGEEEDEDWLSEIEEEEDERVVAAVGNDDIIDAEMVSHSPPRARRERFVGESGRVAGPLDQPEFEALNEDAGEPEGVPAGGSVPERLLATVQAVPWGEMGRRLAAALIGGLALLIAALSGLVGWWRRAVAPQAERVAPGLDRVTHGMTYVTQRSAHAVTDVMRGVLPGERPAPQRQYNRRPTGDGSTFLRTVSLVAPLLLLLVLLGVMWERRGAASDAPPPPATAEEPAPTFEGLVNEARELLMQASNVDSETALTLLARANERLSAALPLAPDEASRTEIETLQGRIQERLGTTTVAPTFPTTTIATLPAGAVPDELVAAGAELYLLDNASGTLYRLPSSAPGTLEPLITNGAVLDSLGTMGTMTFITHMPATETRPTGALLIQTNEGQLFQVEGDTITQATFWPVASTGYRGTATYENNYYVLDPSAPQIWKYVPDDTGDYTANPTSWLQPEGQQQLANPVDLAIDGTIFVLEGDGRVLRFQAGLPLADFALQGAALTQPVALAKLPPEESDLFVAEANRVLRFAADGTFVTDYASPAWGTIRDIAVNADGTALFVLSDVGVQRVELP